MWGVMSIISDAQEKYLLKSLSDFPYAVTIDPKNKRIVESWWQAGAWMRDNIGADNYWWHGWDARFKNEKDAVWFALKWK